MMNQNILMNYILYVWPSIFYWQFWTNRLLVLWCVFLSLMKCLGHAPCTEYVAHILYTTAQGLIALFKSLWVVSCNGEEYF